MTDSQLRSDPVVAAPTGPIIKIARRLGQDPRALANAIPADTLRRTRYAAVEQIDDEGRTLWKHPPYRITT